MVAAPVAFTASSDSVTIISVGGQPVIDGRVSKPLSGDVIVQGGASLSNETTAPQAPLVADAGDSPYAQVGTEAVLLGAGFGGAEPYTFSWASSAGTIVGADAPTAALRDAPPGIHDATLTVTDSKGATATDTVKVIVYRAEVRTLFDRTQLDLTPGTDDPTKEGFQPIPAPGHYDYTFAVPQGTSRIEATLTYKVAANDYDVRLLDPSGTSQACGCDFITPAPNNDEKATVQAPAPGQWTVRIEKFTTVADEFRVVVKALVSEGNATDPRPAVDSGGPYGFAVGLTQSLRGVVAGGTQPVHVAWDLDEDGVFETQGAEVTASLLEGRHIVTLKATDADGFERRETTSVAVATSATAAALTTPITVIAINDSGINPYHLEFSAETYPDPDVLALTNNFTRHPSEYIPGYPADAPALPITKGQGYFPAADTWIWGKPVLDPVTGVPTAASTPSVIEAGKLYWIPGTKIIGAIDPGGSTGVTSGADNYPILDDNGHGTGSASVSAGNRYGYCPTCLVVSVEALSDGLARSAPLNWVDINSNSWGTVGGAPTGLTSGGNAPSRTAVERGQTVLFAAGNGVGNAFDVPQVSYGSQTVGPDWNVIVGAIRRDNQRAIIGDSIPVHISAWGDGNLPSACRTGTVGQCAFSGTSAATPYTAGVFGTVLTEVRRALGDPRAGQRPGQVIAEGIPVPESESLADGKLTRAELREAVLKTALPLNQSNQFSPFPYTGTAPYTGEANVLFEGYGAATPESTRRAIDVLLGRVVMPERAFEESFYRLDRAIRDARYGGYDRNGDGVRDVSPFPSTFKLPDVDLNTVTGALAAIQAAAVAETNITQVERPVGANPLAFYLHRRLSAEPGTSPGCGGTVNELYMDTTNSSGDREPCFETRTTGFAAAYRPVGIFPSSGTLSAPIPAGSTVHVELYLTTETPSMVRPTGVLMATDREIGVGRGPLQPVAGSGPTGAACGTLGEGCWTKFRWSFVTTRPAFTGEQLTFQVQFVGTRSTAFGLEGVHASKVLISPAPMPVSGLSFAASIAEPADGSEVIEGQIVAGGRYNFPDLGSDPTGAGGHPTSNRVEVSVDDPAFSQPIKATLDKASQTWSVELGKLPRGRHVVYARAAIDQTYSEVASSTFTVVPDAHVEWQVVRRNAAPRADAWQRAAGIESYSFLFNTANYENGPNTISVRLVRSGQEAARTTARVQLR